jgi:hypothetical protein
MSKAENTQIVNDFSTVAALDMPGTGKLVVLAIIQHKTYDVAKLMELTGESRRLVQMYRLQWIERQDETSERGETRETGCANFAKDAKHVSCDEGGSNFAHIENAGDYTETSSKLSFTKEEVILPPTPSTAIVVRSWDEDVAATQHKTITIENGRPILHNGTRQYWLDAFDNDTKRLELALIEAMATIQQNSRQAPAVQISRTLARIAGQKHDQNQRYRSAVASRPQHTPAAEQRIEKTKSFRDVIKQRGATQ